MQERAQGRVWSGTAALGQGLIDAIGGVGRAVAIAAQEAGIGETKVQGFAAAGLLQISSLCDEDEDVESCCPVCWRSTAAQ